MRPGDQVGEYVIEDALGQGGMGAVFRAVHRATGTRRALKVVLAAGDADATLRFVREGQAMAAVDDHPNVVRVHGAGTHEGKPYLALQLCAGGDLRGRLRGGPLAPVDAARLVAEIARGVAHIHARGIIHRDLKPENILFDGDRPRVSDFGLARIAGGDKLTVTGAMLGTPRYMAPEQAGGARVDERADVWALGGILLFTLTGHHPYDGNTPLNVVTKLLREDPAWPTSAEAPPALQAILRRAMARDPAQRHPSAAALADELERFAGGDAAGVPRSKLPALAALLALLALAGGIAAGVHASSTPGPAGVPPAPVAPAKTPEPEPVRPAPAPVAVAKPVASPVPSASPIPRGELNLEVGATRILFLDDRHLLVFGWKGVRLVTIGAGKTDWGLKELSNAPCPDPARVGDVVYVPERGGPIARYSVANGGGLAALTPIAVQNTTRIDGGGDVLVVALGPEPNGEPIGRIQVLERATGSLLTTLPAPPKETGTSPFCAVAVAPDGRHFVRTTNKDITLFSLDGKAAVPCWTCTEFDEARAALFLSSSTFVVGTTTRQIVRFDVGSRRPTVDYVAPDDELRLSHKGTLLELASSPDGRWLWSLSPVEVRAWDLAATPPRHTALWPIDGRLEGSILGELPNFAPKYTALAVSPDGSLVATVSGLARVSGRASRDDEDVTADHGCLRVWRLR